jgi:hypothetical protein
VGRAIAVSGFVVGLVPVPAAVASPHGEDMLALLFGGPAYIPWATIGWAAVASLGVPARQRGRWVCAYPIVGGGWGLCLVLVILPHVHSWLPTFDIEMWGLAQIFGVAILVLATIGWYAAAFLSRVPQCGGDRTGCRR